MFQTFRLFLLVAISLGILSCSQVFHNTPMNTHPKLVVGVLLPLSGKNANFGNEMLRAINLAYNDAKNNNVVLKIYDTKADETVAQQVAKQALKDGVSIIIGPLFSNTTRSVVEVTSNHGIPVITFSNDSESILGGKNAYNISPLPASDVENMIHFAIKEKQSKNFVILAPENKYGDIVVATAEKSLSMYGAKLVRTIRYPANSPILTPFVEHLIPTKELAKYNKIKTQLKNKVIVLDENKNPLLSPPAPVLDFDTLLIGDFGKRLILLANHFPSIDLNYKNISILGNSNWNNPEIITETILQGAYFPSFKDVTKTDVGKNYERLYETKFSNIDATAYESLLLVLSCIYPDEDDNVVLNLTKLRISQYESKSALLGNLRMSVHGSSQYSMLINQIHKKTAVEVYNNANVYQEVYQITSIDKDDEINMMPDVDEPMQLDEPSETPSEEGIENTEVEPNIPSPQDVE